jgi:tetratricopeptide (TPR) repeat protein
VRYFEAWTNRGIALEAKGDFRQAVDAYNRALSINPGYQPAKDGLARMRNKVPGSSGGMFGSRSG